MERKGWLRTTGAAAVAPRTVVLIGDKRDWPPEFESLLTAEGFAAGHLPELESVIPIVEVAAVRALFVVAQPLPAVGGTVELRAGTSPALVDEPDAAAVPYVLAAGAIAVLAIAGGAWYARRRWARR